MSGRANDSGKRSFHRKPNGRRQSASETSEETGQSLDGNLPGQSLRAQEAAATSTDLPLAVKQPPIAKRASQTSLLLGKGILKSGTTFPTKEESSHRPESFAAADRRPFESGPLSQGTGIKPTMSEPTRKSSLPSYMPVPPARRLSFADEISEQRPYRGNLATVQSYSVDAVPLTSTGSKEKRYEVESSTEATAPLPAAALASTSVPPIGRGKRVSIDPVRTINILTPDASLSTTTSESAELFRTLRIRRPSSDKATIAARHTDVPEAAGHPEQSSPSSSREYGSDKDDHETPQSELRAGFYDFRNWRDRKRPLATTTVSATELSGASMTESNKPQATCGQKTALDHTNPSVTRRGLRSFLHSEMIEHGLFSDRQPLLSTTLVTVQKPRYPRLVAAGVLVVVVSLVVATVWLLISSRGLLPALSKVAVCATDDCIEHARYLATKLNTSANPCHDFHAYVCGSGPVVGSDVLSSIRTARQQGRELVLALSHARYALFEKHRSSAAFSALRTLDTCTGRDVDQSPEHLAAFMRDRGLRWPEDPNAPGKIGLVQVLDTLFDLAVNWRLALWFDVRVSYLGADGRLVMALDEPGPVAIYRMEQLSDLAPGGYGKLVRAIASMLTQGKAHLKDSAVSELRSDESAIRNVILSTEDPDEHDEWLVPDDTDLGASLLSEEWTSLVNKYLAASGFSTASNVQVLVVQQHRLNALDLALHGVPPERLMWVVGWTFAYVYAWIIDPALDTFQKWGATPSSEEFTSHALCFLAVHESHGIAQAAPMFLETFHAEERGRVVAVLNRTAEALTNFLRGSSIIATDTKRNAALKIVVHVYRSFWPPEPFSQFEVLDLLYGAFPKDTRSFFAVWLESRKALRASAANRYYGSLMLAKYRWRSARVIYLYALNLLLLGLAAVFPPSYLSRGSHVMTYASLGFQMARQLVRAVDDRGRSRDHVGRLHIWRTKIVAASRECLLSKAKSSGERRSIADLFALDLSLAAMKAAADADESPQQLKSLEELSAAQTFYVSYCSHFCDEQPLSQARSMCNLAANASDFAQAFSCPASGVPAARKCLFF